jgi:hypothetical protein
VALPQPDPSERKSGGSPRRRTFRSGGDPRPIAPGVAWFTMCAWCKRVKVGQSWVDDELAPGLLEQRRLKPQLTYGICPGCFDAVTQKAGRQRGFHSDAAVRSPVER